MRFLGLAEFPRGVRLTYFVNGIYGSWIDNLALLRPLVDSGQIQLGNHTWSHPDLTTLTKARISEELTRNDRFLKTTYGISAAPLLPAAVWQAQRRRGRTPPPTWATPSRRCGRFPG